MTKAGGLSASQALRSVLEAQSRGELDGGDVVAGLAVDLRHLGHRQDGEVRVHLGAPLVDLQPAGRVAQLREVLVELRDAAADVGPLLDEHDLLPGLGGLDGGRETADASADHQDGLVGGYDVRHG